MALDPFTALTAASSGALADAMKDGEKKLIGSIARKVSNLIGPNYERIRLIMGSDSDRYITGMSVKCSTIKTLLNRNTPVDINDIFVCPEFLYRDKNGIQKTCGLHDVLNRASGGENLNIITGLAGCGKSVLLKYIFNQVLINGDTVFPLFFEFRELFKSSHFGPGSLLKSLLDDVQKAVPSFNSQRLEAGLEHGHFYLLFDGFDEVPLQKRQIISDEINGIARRFPSCRIIVTSRPSRDFISWFGFRELLIQPFPYFKIIEYINKVPFDLEKKKGFVELINKNNKELYENYKSFLENPLLTGMMLLVYDSRNEVPRNKFAFYEKCYDVLTQEHDALKGRYRRELFSDKPIEYLSTIFSYFCVFSFKDEVFVFDSIDASNYIRKAIRKYPGIDDTAKSHNLILQDFTESLSILQQDGMTYEFIHRSFQEYFYAKFSIERQNVSLKRAIDAILKRSDYTNVLTLIEAVGGNLYEKEFILPAAEIITEYCEDASDSDKTLIVCDELLQVFGVPEFELMDESHVPRYYYEELSSSTDDDRNLKRCYVRILVDYITRRHSMIFASKEASLERYRRNFAAYPFEQCIQPERSENGEDIIKIHRLRDDILRQSGLLDYAQITLEAIKDLTSRLRDKASRNQNDWDDEFKV